jgi:hypothetical protein
MESFSDSIFSVDKMKSCFWSEVSTNSVSAPDIVQCTQMCLKIGAGCNVFKFEEHKNICTFGQVKNKFLNQPKTIK